MNSDIMHISNTLIYENYLRAADDSVATQCLSLSLASSSFQKEADWVRGILSSKQGVTLVDTDRFKEFCRDSQQVTSLREKKIQTLSFKRRAIGSQRRLVSEGPSQNQGLDDSGLFEESDEIYMSERMEEDMAVLLIGKYMKYGVQNSAISVITPYNSERGYLYEKLEVVWCDAQKNDVEVLTIDKSQGIDKDIIVFVYPDRISGNDTYLMKNWRRLNVAYTRAKKKLLIVGSRQSMREVEQLGKLLDILEEKKWVYEFSDEVLKGLVI